MELSARYGQLSEELKGFVRIKAPVWKILRENSKSIAEADRQWEMSEHGMRERELEIEMKALEKEMSSIKAYLRVMEEEARNQY